VAGVHRRCGSARHVSISCADKLAEIRYTTDGSATTTATLTKAAYYGGLYPDDKANRAAHWLDERAAMQEATGMWSNAVEYVDGKVTIDEDNEFAIAEPDAGRKTAILLNVTFDWLASDRGTDPDDVKAGVRINTNGCFQVYAFADGARRWIDVTAAGVTPTMGTDYTVKLVLYGTSMKYTAAIVSGMTENPLVAADGVARFGYANQSHGRVESLRFKGEGKVESFEGDYKLHKGISASIK